MGIMEIFRSIGRNYELRVTSYELRIKNVFFCADKSRKTIVETESGFFNAKTFYPLTLKCIMQSTKRAFLRVVS